MLGRFKKLKGLHVLLEAWLTLEEKKDRHLTLIGSAEDMEKRNKHTIGKKYCAGRMSKPLEN